MDAAELAGATGLVGVAFYLGSYAALQAGLIRGSGYLYAVLNLIAAALVLVSLTAEFNLSSAIIQISWILISVVGMARVYILTQALRFTAEETELIERRLATLPRLAARRLLNGGGWRVGSKGHVLTTEGQPVVALSYIASGAAQVLVGGRAIATLGPGEFVGEMACIKQGPASATVRLTQDTTYFEIRSAELSRQIRRDPDLGPHLEFSFAGNIRAKLRQTNALLRQALERESAAADQVTD